MHNICQLKCEILKNKSVNIYKQILHMESIMEKMIKPTKLWHALFILTALLATLAWGIILHGLPAHALLFIVGMFAATFGILVLNYKWDDIQESIFESIKIGLIAILILIVVGSLIGTWMLSGIVPSMIYYGMQVINPQYFLLCALIMSSITALGTGSSWSTMATVGVALMGISEGLGIPASMTAGAVISGSYFGDKLSPLSDTSNLSCACAKSELIAHIKHMQWSSIPTYIITVIVFIILGFQIDSANNIDNQTLNEILSTIKDSFYLSPFFLIFPVIVIGLVFLKMPAIPGLFLGTILGGIVALIFQQASLTDILKVILDGFTIDTGFEFVDNLLSRGGMNSMMSTILLILNALILGGVLEKIGVISVITQNILKLAKSMGDLTLAVVTSCIFVNIVAADQYLSLILPGNMYAKAYQDRNSHPKNLSRTLQDSGTVTSVLIPWNSCGAFAMASLGVDPWIYVPFAVFNYISPIMSVLYAYMGWTMPKIEEENEK